MNKEQNNNDEISLIDLFVVLLKYRKLIIAPALVALVITVIGYFVYPPYRYNAYVKNESPKVTANYESRMVINLSPGAGYFLPNQQIGFYFSKPDVITRALGSIGINGSPEILPLWIPTDKGGNAEEKIYVSSNERIVVKENSKTRIIELSCNGFKDERARIFLQELFALGNADVETAIKSLGEAYIASFERTLQNANLSGFEQSQIENGREYYFLARGIMAGDLRAFSVVIEPYTVTVTAQEPAKSLGDFRNNYTKTALVCIFALLFLSIFTAFFLNTIHNIKHDEDAMKKIRDALGKTGGKQR